MELTYKGANCLKISTKQANIVIDDNLKDLGLKESTKDGDVVVKTSSEISDSAAKPKIVIDQPGEYEVSDISIIGVAARSHMGEEGNIDTTMYKVIAGDVSVAITGHVFEDITEDQVEELGHVDVLVIPVGNKGYTLDGRGAHKVIKKIEPRLVIPVHYADNAIKYEVEQDALDEALKLLEIEPSETAPKLKLKPSDIPETLKLIVLERQ